MAARRPRPSDASLVGHTADASATITASIATRSNSRVVNLSILKNGRARAVRFNTLTAICDVLNCQPGDVLTVDRDRY